MKQAQTQYQVSTGPGVGCYEITPQLTTWIQEQQCNTGMVTVFVAHTSASLIIQENADPDVRWDLEQFFQRLIPSATTNYRHHQEGPDDMPAHIRSVLTQTQVCIPIASGRLALGAWQGIYLYEHRTAPHRRTVIFHLIGE